MTEPTSARILTPEQLDTARDIVQTWSCDPIRGGRSVVRIDQVLTELLGVHQLTEEIDWLRVDPGAVERPAHRGGGRG